eukprot:3052573-Rhodomonas_salina.2
MSGTEIGYGGTGGAWAIRTVITSPSPLTTTMEVEALKLGYAEIWFPFGANSLRDAFTMSMHVEADATGTQFTLNALFETREEALAIKAAAMPAWEIVSQGAVVDDGPEVYRWIGASTSDELSIRPTGLTVDNVRIHARVPYQRCICTVCAHTFWLPYAGACEDISALLRARISVP